MKRYLAFGVLGAAAVLLGSGVILANLSGSAHDFSGYGWSGGEICKPCHTPHGGNTTIPEAPLWNHALSAATYTVYSTTTLNAAPLGQPSGISALCLSCHDNTVAVDSFGGQTGTTMISNAAFSAAANLGTNLSGSHPISFTYDTTLASADGELYDPSTATTTLGGTIANDLLFSGKLECASCHDVHNSSNIAKLLRYANTGSQLCLDCHDK